MSTTKTGSTGDIRPGGEAVKEALRWISNARRDDPKAKLAALIEQASVRFDLSPVEEEFLLQTFSKET